MKTLLGNLNLTLNWSWSGLLTSVPRNTSSWPRRWGSPHTRFLTSHLFGLVQLQKNFLASLTSSTLVYQLLFSIQFLSPIDSSELINNKSFSQRWRKSHKRCLWNQTCPQDVNESCFSDISSDIKTQIFLTSPNDHCLSIHVDFIALLFSERSKLMF